MDKILKSIHFEKVLPQNLSGDTHSAAKKRYAVSRKKKTSELELYLSGIYRIFNSIRVPRVAVVEKGLR